ncbi:hypothetical protein [Amaricoccus tamworthensis]|uniref:hypothetical protein n=1 Tax=Amaricoccus tamworthensis TaxID=57002 RepID=UPI003C7D0954
MNWRIIDEGIADLGWRASASHGGGQRCPALPPGVSGCGGTAPLPGWINGIGLFPRNDPHPV